LNIECVQCGVSFLKKGNNTKFCSKTCYYKNNTLKGYQKSWTKRNPVAYLLRIAKHRAKKRGIKFNLTKDDIVLPTHCPVLGIKLEVNFDTGAGGKDSSYSLDRIDSSKGYIPGNVQVISNKANSMKFTATEEELLKFAKWIMENYEHSGGA
jgi:hypothetical protein